jgi:hypothetical protein
MERMLTNPRSAPAQVQKLAGKVRSAAKTDENEAAADILTKIDKINRKRANEVNEHTLVNFYFNSPCRAWLH